VRPREGRSAVAVPAAGNNVLASPIKHQMVFTCDLWFYFKPSSPSYCWITP
jgi:hypothetical protein